MVTSDHSKAWTGEDYARSKAPVNEKMMCCL
jgi:hypothetical protein